MFLNNARKTASKPKPIIF
jgi:WD40 repeat protein